VQTSQGIYTPRTNEVWWSEGRYRDLEEKLADLIEATRKAQTRLDMSF
jgi:hypothetical protein